MKHLGDITQIRGSGIEPFGRKYVTARDLEPYRVKFNGAVMFLDYIRADRTAWKEEGSEKAKKPNGF